MVHPGGPRPAGHPQPLLARQPLRLPGHLPGWDRFGGNGGICTIGLTEYRDVIGFEGGYDRLDQAVLLRTGFHLAEQSPAKYASAITVPTLVGQVHDDVMTTPEAVQAVHDAIPVEDRKMHWIYGTSRRFDGYSHFSEHPEVAVAWFDDRVR
ncbi:hypothetical protein [Streptomyces fuscichromogenes]|uniref:Uncharacterized protein n=1 Tax=Streptomyces fuscichromogenes TaxID=1324013 RepID=A0A917XPS7_9ACTN|nr:hypothetical protein [Streptomyces fuscichromogenes]GGN44333.1 hypothetical protein GCM10011578_095180 [Streptomyces fuscichromogenes]